MKFNEQQLEALNHNKGPLLVSAGPGSGKTRIIVARVARLVHEGIDPQSILATTFTKKAATEMTDRLKSYEVDTNIMAIQTMHSFCYRLLEHETYKGWQFDEDKRYGFLVKQATGFRGMKWMHVDLSLVENFISLAKNSLVRPEQALDWSLLQEEPFFGDTRYVQAYFEIEEMRQQRRLYTHDDMLIDAVELLRDSPSVRARVQNKYKWVIVDEFQDSNLAQIKLVEYVADPEWNLMAVGDVDQCQPPGTMVKVGSDYVPIETLSSGDSVKTWDRHAAKIVGHQPIQISVRDYHGTLYTVDAGGYRTRATRSHHWFVKWNRHHERWVTYLMYRKDRGYRVGWCKLFTNNKPRTYHLAQRARLEKADAAWILSVHNNPQEASIQESIVAARYGIPTVMFEPTKGANHYTEDAIKRIFDAVFIGGKYDNAHICLDDHGRDYRYPLYERNKMPIGGNQRGTIFVTRSCNLIPELMSVPTEEGWHPIKLRMKLYTGPVYSLNVKKHHSYVADGIVTHNCIYEWRGAVPKFMVNFDTTFPAMPKYHTVSMGMNYRSAPNIVDHAAQCIANNENRITKELVANKKAPALIKAKHLTDMDEEANYIADEIKTLHEGDGVPYGSMFVLYRVNAQSRAIEEVFSKRKIPHVVLGSSSFYQRKEVQDILSYLRLIHDPNDLEAGERAINRPFRFIAKGVVNDIIQEAERIDGTFEEAADSIARRTGNARIDQFLDVMTEMREMDKSKKVTDDSEIQVEYSIGHLISMFVARTKFIEYLEANEGSDTAENSREANIGELIRSADRYKEIKEFLDFVNWQIAERKKKKRTKNSVTCMTIHRAKGLEARTVFLIGVNEQILPHAKAPEPKEEERRLFYVGVTRAMEFLFITAVEQLGVEQKLILQPSRFISEAGIALEKYSPDGDLFVEVDDKDHSEEAINESMRIGQHFGEAVAEYERPAIEMTPENEQAIVDSLAQTDSDELPDVDMYFDPVFDEPDDLPEDDIDF